MQVNGVLSYSFGMAKVSPDIEKMIERGRAQVKGTEDEDDFEYSVKTLREIMPDSYVETKLKRPIIGKIFNLNLPAREDIYVDGRNRTYINGVPVSGEHSARRIECLAEALRNIDACEKEKECLLRDAEFEALDKAFGID